MSLLIGVIIGFVANVAWHEWRDRPRPMPRVDGPLAYDPVTTVAISLDADAIVDELRKGTAN